MTVMSALTSIIKRHQRWTSSRTGGGFESLKVELVGSYSNPSPQVEKCRELQESIGNAGSTGQRRQVPRSPWQEQTRLGPEMMAEFENDYRRGIAVDQRASKYNIRRNTVRELGARLGLPGRYPRLCPADIEEAAVMYRSGQSLATIGKHFDVASDTVALALRKLGVEIRKRRGA
jgi:hypothetical protein